MKTTTLMRTDVPRIFRGGLLAAARFRRFLDAGRIRAAVLLTAAASAVILIAHSLLG